VIDLSDITDEEGRVILRALKHLRYESVQSQRKNAREGWVPKPGSVDVNVRTIRVIDNLLARANSQGGR
jgi:hypothetical protein